MRLEDIVDAERLEALYRPIGEAYGLPGAVYGQAFYELENRYVFPRGWAAVGVGGEIPDPGDAVPVMLGDWPLILLRNQEGRINVFHNVCRHRGMRVLPALCRGRKALKCPWHSWTYDLDGKRIATPDIGGPGVDRATGVARGIDGLVAARVALWHDFIFVNIGGNAPPLRGISPAHRRPVRRLRALELALRRRVGMHLRRQLEGFHGRRLSRTTMRVGGIRNCGATPYRSRTTSEITVTSMPRSVSEVIMREDVEDKRIYNRALPTLSKPGVAANGRAYVANLFPTGHRPPLPPDHVLFVLFTPDGWDRTRIVFYYYFAGEAAIDPAYEDSRRAIKDEWELIGRQDDDYVRYVHANTKMRDEIGPCGPCFSSYWEGGGPALPEDGRRDDPGGTEGQPLAGPGSDRINNDGRFIRSRCSRFSRVIRVRYRGAPVRPIQSTGTAAIASISNSMPSSARRGTGISVLAGFRSPHMASDWAAQGEELGLAMIDDQHDDLDHSVGPGARRGKRSPQVDKALLELTLEVVRDENAIGLRPVLTRDEDQPVIVLVR